ADVDVLTRCGKTDCPRRDTVRSNGDAADPVPSLIVALRYGTCASVEKQECADDGRAIGPDDLAGDRACRLSSDRARDGGRREQREGRNDELHDCLEPG